MKRIPWIYLLVVALTIGLPPGVEANGKERIKVREVSFSGNTVYPSSRLEGLMLTRPSRFLAPSYYFPEIFADDLENILTFYRQNGYLDVLITDTTVTIDSLHKRVDILIAIVEGPLTRVEGITVFGNEFFPDSVLRPLIRLQKGDALRRPIIENAISALLSLYGEHGFIDAVILPEVKINPEAHLAVVDILIKEKLPTRIDSVIISGCEKTKSNVITRELAFHPGDTIRFSQFMQSQRRLYLTGLFDNVFVRPRDRSSLDPGRRDVHIELKEKMASEFSVLVGYGSVEKLRGKIELTTTNFSGRGRLIGVATEANFIKQGIVVSFSEPWTFGTRLKTDLNLFGELRREPGYRAESFGSRLTLGRRISGQANTSISYRLENTNFTEIDVKSKMEEHDPRIRSLTLSASYDSRDNLFDPHRGLFLALSGEIAGSFLQGSDTFARTTLMARQFIPFGRRMLIGSAVEIGWMKSFGDHDEIPLSERFYAGGPNSLRGFGYQLVGPRDDNGEPLGGKMKLIWNVIEVRHSIYRVLGGAIFCDAGNVWDEPDEIKFSGFRLDIGIGLRFNSPIGLIRLDYGLNLDRERDEPRGKLFLAMGQAF